MNWIVFLLTVITAIILVVQVFYSISFHRTLTRQGKRLEEQRRILEELSKLRHEN